jgi:steroid 5-alpha reductase family enzyme
MTSIGELLALNAAVLAVIFVGLWLISLALHDVSFVDSWWAFGLGGLGLAAFLETPNYGDRQRLLVSLVVAWALRLGIYIFWRWRKHGPDPRYQAIVKHAKSARGWSFATTSGLQVFALQGVLQFIVSLPVQLGQWDGDGTLGIASIVGGAIALFGLLFETIGDAQLVAFKSDPANKGKVLDRGVWRTTRHPNYFGEACFWWGLFLIAAQTPLGWWSLPAPILVTFLLTRISGVPMLEASMKKKPDHAAYAARTPSFFPWFLKKA